MSQTYRSTSFPFEMFLSQTYGSGQKWNQDTSKKTRFLLQSSGVIISMYGTHTIENIEL